MSQSVIHHNSHVQSWSEIEGDVPTGREPFALAIVRNSAIVSLVFSTITSSLFSQRTAVASGWAGTLTFKSVHRFSPQACYHTRRPTPVKTAGPTSIRNLVLVFLSASWLGLRAVRLILLLRDYRVIASLISSIKFRVRQRRPSSLA